MQNFGVGAPIFTTPANDLLTLGVTDPKLGSWGLLNQVLRFFWRGVYMIYTDMYERYSHDKDASYQEGVRRRSLQGFLQINI